MDLVTPTKATERIIAEALVAVWQNKAGELSRTEKVDSTREK
jgi:hypothetical protein